MLKKMVKGSSYIFKAFSFFRLNKRYLQYLLWPVVLNTILYVGILLGVYNFVSPIIDSCLITPAPDAWYSVTIPTINFIIQFVVYLFILTISAFSFIYVLMIIEAPFLAILSEKVEAELFNNEFDTSGMRNFIYSVILGVKNSIILLVITVFWSFIFFIGNFILPAVSSLLGIIIIGYFYGVSFMTYSAELRGHSYFSLRKILKGVKFEVLGFGVLGYLFVLIPLFAPIFLPIAVVGATMLYNECIEKKSFDIKLLNK